MRGHHRHDGHGRRFAHDGHPHERADGRPERGRSRHEGGGHGGPERGRRRLFDHGELRLVVLALIAESERHGYEIIKEVEDRTAGTYSPSPGVIYPTLTLLEELGHATVAERDGKKLYAITAAGLADLEARRPAVQAAMGRMQAVRSAHGDGPAPELIRATENLKLALRLRQGRGPLTEDQVRSIAAALDSAAVAVERS